MNEGKLDYSTKAIIDLVTGDNLVQKDCVDVKDNPNINGIYCVIIELIESKSISEIISKTHIG